MRRAPQQDRSTRRVTAFLEAAEALFAELGFEAATMTAIAERAGSSIGALYSYFPDKKAIALALMDTYAAQIKDHWRELFEEVATYSSRDFSEHFIDRFLDFVAEHPAYLQLQAAPIRLRRSTGPPKRAFRASLIEALRRRVPTLGPKPAELRVGVMLQIVQGMVQMYNDAEPSERTTRDSGVQDGARQLREHRVRRTMRDPGEYQLRGTPPESLFTSPRCAVRCRAAWNPGLIGGRPQPRQWFLREQLPPGFPTIRRRASPAHEGGSRR